MATDTIDLAGFEGGPVSLATKQLDELDSRIQGRLLRAGDQGWDEAVLTWNAMVARTPALVLQPVSAADVAAGVRFARDHGLLLGVKGGGHNIAGTAIAEGGLTLDLSRMQNVIVDPDAKLAHVGPGCRLGDVDQATQAQGLATVLGFVSETGMAGLTLGGGWGYLTRRFGWTVDNLAEVEVVGADGQIRTANPSEHGELFWALRGGGGNFGVVTRFSFRLHQVGPTITGGLIAWSADRAADVLATYRELTESAPRELTAAMIMRLAPPAPFVPSQWHGKPIAGMLLCHSGADPAADLAVVRALGDPILDLVTPKPYVAMQSMLNALEPKGLHRYWKSEFLPGVSSGFCDSFCDRALQVTSPLSHSLVFHLAGALNDREGDDGAVGNRDARYIASFAGTWPPHAPSDPHVAWVRWPDERALHKPARNRAACSSRLSGWPTGWASIVCRRRPSGAGGDSLRFGTASRSGRKGLPARCA